MPSLRSRRYRPVRVMQFPGRMSKCPRRVTRAPVAGPELQILVAAILFGAAVSPLRADVYAAFSVGESSYCAQVVCGNALPVCGSEPGTEVGTLCEAPCGSQSEVNGRCTFVPGPIGIKEVVWNAYTRATCPERCTAIARFVTNVVVISVIDRPVSFQLDLDQQDHSTLSFTWPLGQYTEADGTVEVNSTPRQGVLQPGTYSIRVSGQSSCASPPGGAGTIEVHLKFGAIFWNNPNGGAYQVAQNWAPEQIPLHNEVQSDVAVVNLPGVFGIDLTGATAGRLLVRNATSIDIWGGGEVYGPDPEEPSLGIGENARLNVIGGTFRSVHACIGDGLVTNQASDPAAAAQVHVSNPGTCWEATGVIEIGRAVEGQLHVLDGCVNGREVRIGIGAPGEVRLNKSTALGDGGRLTCENLTVGAELATPGRGTLQLENGGRADAQIVRIGETGRVQGTGVLAAVERVENFGQLAPGLSAGRLTIEGDYVQRATGVLELEISGAGPGQFDILHVTGDTTLGGTMLLKFVDGYIPAVGTTFRCLEMDGGTFGQFAAVQAEGLPAAHRVMIDLQTGAVTVRSKFALAELRINGIRTDPALALPQ